MKNSLLSSSYIPHFEGSLLRCRKIHDHMVIFDRDGTIVGARTNDPRLKEGSNFYTFMAESERTLISDLCNSFDIRWIAVDTEAGCAAIHTAFYGACRLLFAVIFSSPKEQVRDYLTDLHSRAIYVSPALDTACGGKEKDTQVALISETFSKAENALSCQSITEARYRLGANIGKFLAERILTIADYVGCVGSCKTSLDFIPRLDSFSSELFTVISSCATLFARNKSRKRSFEAKIEEYKEHLLVSLCVEVDEDFALYTNRKLSDRLLYRCESIAFDREAYFDCSLFEGETPRLVLSYVPETDPMIGRRIKQDIKSYIHSFWE